MNWKKAVLLAWTSALLLLLFLPYLQSGTSIQASYEDKKDMYEGPALAQVQSNSTVHHSGLPKVDEIIFKAYPGVTPDVVVQEFLDGETDWIEGPYISDLYSDVVDAGHKVSEMHPGLSNQYSYTFFMINCRDYKYTNGNPNMPLNDSDFRLALPYVYGMDDKQADIDSYYNATLWIKALGNPVPPAQEPWYDDATTMPNTDNEIAWNILSSAGYTVQNYSGQPWLHKNSVPIRPPNGPNTGLMVLRYSTSCGKPDGPLEGLARNWNAFLQDHVGADGPLMEAVPTDFTTLVTDLLAIRDYDVISIGLYNLGGYVDWIYEVSHSSNDVPWGWNFCGIHDDDFDMWSEIMMTSLDVEEVIEATENFTRKFVNEIMPWFPVSTGLKFCTTARDERGELTNIVSMNNLGSMNSWSYMTIHWRGEPDIAWPGGNLTVAMEDEVSELNPFVNIWFGSKYDWEILHRPIVGLTMVEPDNLMNMPFVATDWEISNWTSIPELGIVNGCRCTFWLRQDVKWHDGRPVTAYDCVENMRVMRENQPFYGESSTWRRLIHEEANGPYEFNFYFTQSTPDSGPPSLYLISYVAKIALLSPKHIIQLVEKQVDDGILGDIRQWRPCDNAYQDLTGELPPAEYPFLKQLVGCGPFVFDYYNRNQVVGRVERYQDFFVNAPVISSVVGEWHINPFDSYTYSPLVQNMAAVEADENSTFTNVTVYVKVYEDDILAHEVGSIHLDPWNWTYLEPYTIENVTCGLHNITIAVYDYANQTVLHSYTHTFVATVREDLSTYTGELLDFKVDMRDVGRVGMAFGSSPGHPRWDQACDVNNDFKVDMRDIGNIARKFGWTCP